MFKSDQRNLNLNITDHFSQVDENSKKNEPLSSEQDSASQPQSEPLTLEDKVFKEQCKLFDLATKLGVKDKLVQRKIDILIRSKLFRDYSVQKVTRNSGGQTAGVDNQLLITEQDKNNMSENLLILLKNYKSKPLRFVYRNIPKGNDKLRPLDIPSSRSIIQDKCLQQLIALIFEPIVELNSDPNNYGYRKFRSAKNALGTLRSKFRSNTNSENKYVFDCDIKGFFDNINQE
jgi:retron-type reverse transcriptase